MDAPTVPFAWPLPGHRTDFARWLDRGLAALDLSTQTRGAPNGDAHRMRERSRVLDDPCMGANRSYRYCLGRQRTSTSRCRGYARVLVSAESFPTATWAQLALQGINAYEIHGHC